MFVNQTLCRPLVGRELHLLPVQEPEEVSGNHGGLARGVTLEQTLDLSSSGGRTPAPPHCALHAKTEDSLVIPLLWERSLHPAILPIQRVFTW